MCQTTIGYESELHKIQFHLSYSLARQMTENQILRAIMGNGKVDFIRSTSSPSRANISYFNKRVFA